VSISEHLGQTASYVKGIFGWGTAVHRLAEAVKNKQSAVQKEFSGKLNIE